MARTYDNTATRHIFEMTESGGVQRVIAKDAGDNEQITLIQKHLQHEAMRFGTGDFSDPTSLHGADMPGIKELAAGAAKMPKKFVANPDAPLGRLSLSMKHR